MKIGFITDYIDDFHGGISVYSTNLLRELLIINNNNYYSIHSTNTRNPLYKDCMDIVMPLPAIPFYRKYAWKNYTLPYDLKNLSVDVMHDPTGVAPFLTMRHYKKIVTIFDTTPIVFPALHPYLTRWQFSKTLKKLTRPFVDCIITISQSTKNDLVNKLGSTSPDIKVIYLGVSNEYHSEHNKTVILATVSKYKIVLPFFLFVGTLEPRKNIELLLKAYAKICSTTQASLVIVGAKGWKYKSIFDTHIKLGLGKSVIFLEHVPEKELVHLYNAASLFVYPSLYEGFGLPPLEAMACGCPVITSNTSSFPEVVGDAGIMVDPYSADELATAMDRVLTDDNLRKKMTYRGLQRAKQFSWEKTAKETINTYKDVIVR